MAPTRRRGSGEGSVYQETRTRVGPDGLPMATTPWVATVEDQRSLMTGKRRQVKLRAKTKAAAVAKASEYRKRRAAGITAEPDQTVEAFLTGWIDYVVTARVKPITVDNYEQVVRLHLIPALGRVKLRSLTPEHVDAFLKAKADSGLSRRYVGRMRSVLTDALTHAERRSLVTRTQAAYRSCRPARRRPNHGR
jgi:integrase